MKKRSVIIITVLCLLAAFAATGCSNGADAKWRSTDCSQYVNVGQYRGVEYLKAKSNPVTEADVDEYINRLLAAKSTVETLSFGKFAEGDEVKMDFSGKSGDETEIEYSGYITVLGSSGFFDIFEGGLSSLIGMDIKEKVEIKLTYNAGQDETKAGRTLDFVFTVNSVKRYHNATADAEFLNEQGGYESLEAYREAVKEKIALKNEKDVRADAENQVWKAVLASTNVTEYPAGAAEEYAEFLESYYAKKASSLAMDKSDFSGLYFGSDSDDVIEDAKLLTKQELAVRRIAALEGIKADARDASDFIERAAAQRGVDASYIRNNFSGDLIELGVLHEKVTAFLMENAVCESQTDNAADPAEAQTAQNETSEAS